MNIEKIKLNYLHALLGLLTPCLPPVVMENAEQFKMRGRKPQISLVAIRICESWEKDAQQFWKHAITCSLTWLGRWDAQDCWRWRTFLRGDGACQLLEREEWEGTWQKPSFLSPVYLQGGRAETIYLIRHASYCFHLLIFLRAVNQFGVDLSAP